MSVPPTTHSFRRDVLRDYDGSAVDRLSLAVSLPHLRQELIQFAQRCGADLAQYTGEAFLTGGILNGTALSYKVIQLII
jgi:hypothetical protein